jgi:two-component system, NtrC family, sensor kinase
VRTPKRTTRPRASNGKPKARADVPPDIAALLEIAACAGHASPRHALSLALGSLATALHADRCTVAIGAREQRDVIAESSSSDPSRADEVETRAAITLGGESAGELTAYSTEALEQPSVMLLGHAATLIAPTLFSLRLGDSSHERDHAFTQRVLDSLPLGMHVVDRDFRICAWNRTRENGLQGVQRDEALGRSIFEVLNRQSESDLRREFDAVFETGEILRFDVESGSGPGARVYRMSKAPIRNAQGEVTHVITIGEDVTDAVRAQEEVAQARKLAAVGTLAAGAMHEINNPLATIGACAETLALQLADDSLPESLRESLAELCGIIDHEVHRSKRILNGLLDFSRPTGATRSPGDLRDIIEQTLRLLKYHPTFKAMHVDVDVSTDTQLLVRADRDQLVQVLMALMLNAMDAMGHTGTIRLKVFRSPVRGEELIMEVIDHGSGISPTVRQRLFEPFFTTKPPGRGTGLGLAICYGIVADHGGRIEVDSTLRKGSTFRVILPLVESAT